MSPFTDASRVTAIVKSFGCRPGMSGPARLCQLELTRKWASRAYSHLNGQSPLTSPWLLAHLVGSPGC
jgi:hypothetical protein